MNKMQTTEQVGGGKLKLRLPSWLRRSQKKPKNNSHLIQMNNQWVNLYEAQKQKRPNQYLGLQEPKTIEGWKDLFIKQSDTYFKQIGKLREEIYYLTQENEKLKAKKSSSLPTTVAETHPLMEEAASNNEGLKGKHPLIAARNALDELTRPVAGTKGLFNTTSSSNRSRRSSSKRK